MKILSALANDVLTLVLAFKTCTMTRSDWQKWKIWSLRVAKNMVFRPRYAQCLTATTSLPLVSKHIYFVKYSKQQNCKFRSCIGCIIQSLFRIFGSL